MTQDAQVSFQSGALASREELRRADALAILAAASNAGLLQGPDELATVSQISKRISWRAFFRTRLLELADPRDYPDFDTNPTFPLVGFVCALAGLTLGLFLGPHALLVGVPFCLLAMGAPIAATVAVWYRWRRYAALPHAVVRARLATATPAQLSGLRGSAEARACGTTSALLGRMLKEIALEKRVARQELPSMHEVMAAPALALPPSRALESSIAEEGELL